MTLGTFLVSYFPIVVIILIVIFALSVISAVRRMERRAEERLKIDKENLHLQQKQMNEINTRLSSIESILKEVD